MKSDDLTEVASWFDGSYVDLLAKAILLNKVTIIDGRIMVKAFKEDE